jgi:hypothetical protein
MTLSIFLTHGKNVIYIYIYKMALHITKKKELTMTMNKKYLTDKCVWQIRKYSEQ